MSIIPGHQQSERSCNNKHIDWHNDSMTLTLDNSRELCNIELARVGMFRYLNVIPSRFENRLDLSIDFPWLFVNISYALYLLRATLFFLISKVILHVFKQCMKYHVRKTTAFIIR